MYTPAHFTADDRAVRDLLHRHGAADLVTTTDQGLLATLLPFVYDPAAGPHGALRGRVEAKFKLSQNRPAADIDGVVRGLRQRGDLDSAEAVESHRPPAS